MRAIITLLSPYLSPLGRFRKKEDGATAVEYAVLLALLIVACVVAVITLGENASGTFAYVGCKASST